jgi:hypothetical protein
VYLGVILYNVPEETVYFTIDGSSLVDNNLLLIGFKYYSSVPVILLIGVASGIAGGQLIYRRIRATGRKQTFLNALILSLLTITIFLTYAVIAQQLEAIVSRLLTLLALLLPIAIAVTALFGKRIVERGEKHSTQH